MDLRRLAALHLAWFGAWFGTCFGASFNTRLDPWRRARLYTLLHTRLGARCGRFDPHNRCHYRLRHRLPGLRSRLHGDGWHTISPPAFMPRTRLYRAFHQRGRWLNLALHGLGNDSHRLSPLRR
jgi:hypothetical protein